MSSILVINAGSSSVKYQLVDAETGECAASGLVERIGEATGLIEHRADETTVERETAIPDHAAAFDLMRGAFEAAGPRSIRSQSRPSVTASSWAAASSPSRR